MKKFLFLLFCVVCLGTISSFSQQNYARDYEPSKAKDTGVEESMPLLKMPSDASLSRGQEWRSFWVDAWNKGVFNASEVKEVVQIASNYGYNAIVVQVRRRGDCIYFPTYPNTEPRMSGLASDFDTLREMIRLAHASNIEVHAWITTFLVSTSTPPSSSEHVFNKHPEYLMENDAGVKNIAEGYYLDPGNPDALAWNSRVVMDIVQNYEIDGIHFDYIRYPQQNAGYNPVAIARYNKEFGLTGKPAYNDARFSEWRRRQITDWLRGMYTKIIQIKPMMKVTAATFPSRSDAYGYRFQDWAQWMKEGILDANLPMNYTTSISTFQTRTQDILANSYGRHVYVGAGAYLIDMDNLVAQLRYARSMNAQGILFFSYANNNKGGDWKSCFERLKQDVFSAPATVPDMPWKTNRDKGFITGKVSDKKDGSALYNVQITIPELQLTVKTDVQGYFSLLYVAIGTYTLKCEIEGYVPQETKITVVGGCGIPCDISLDPQ